MSWADLAAAAEDVRLAAPAAAAASRLPLVGIGWATVDQERACAQLDALLAADPGAPRLGPWSSIDRDPDLGARAWLRAPTAPEGGIALVVLEPDTEGRLAASLARFGEGVAVIYLGEGLPRPGRLLQGGRAWDPHVVVMASQQAGS